MDVPKIQSKAHVIIHVPCSLISHLLNQYFLKNLPKRKLKLLSLFVYSFKYFSSAALRPSIPLYATSSSCLVGFPTNIHWKIISILVAEIIKLEIKSTNTITSSNCQNLIESPSLIIVMIFATCIYYLLSFISKKIFRVEI